MRIRRLGRKMKMGRTEDKEEEGEENGRRGLGRKRRNRTEDKEEEGEENGRRGLGRKRRGG
jgi:hypothetical protein